MERQSQQGLSAIRALRRNEVTASVPRASALSIAIKASIAAFAIAAPLSAGAVAIACPFESGDATLEREGLIITRYALGMTGNALVANTSLSWLDPSGVAAVVSNIQCPDCGLDINGNGVVDTTDATIISRKLAGFTGNALTNGLALGSDIRNTPAVIQSFLTSGCGSASSAWAQGGNAFGAPGVIGTNDAQNMTVKSGGSEASLVIAGNSGLRVFGLGSPAEAVTNTILGSAANARGDLARGGAVGGGGRGGAHNCITRASGVNNRQCFNFVDYDYATVSGGLANHALQTYSFVGGGESNTAYSYASTVGGGSGNSTEASFATVAGGDYNRAIGEQSTVAGGKGNVASGVQSFVGGGNLNFASGLASMVVGGVSNVASGDFSAAAGRGARASRNGQFVWADSQFPIFDPVALNLLGTRANTFLVRATGGVEFVSGINTTSGAPTSGCYIIDSGTGWNCYSDRNLKDRVADVSPKWVLEKLMTIPIQSWYMLNSSAKQFGPMAQDFYRAFGLGDTDRAINNVDVQGVALAAIQGLHEVVREKDAKIDALERANATLAREMAAIKRKLGM